MTTGTAGETRPARGNTAIHEPRPVSQPAWPANHGAITAVPSVAQGSSNRPYPYTMLPQDKRGLQLSQALTTQPLPDVGNDSAQQKCLSDPAQLCAHALGHIHRCHTDRQQRKLFYRHISLPYLFYT